MLRLSGVLAFIVVFSFASCTAHRPALRGTGDLGVIIERSVGRIQIVETSGHTRVAQVDGLGDLSHASVVFSRDARFAYVFGRDGGLTKVDLLEARIAKRIIQSGNSIGGAISQDGRLVAVSNYTPGGVRIFDAESLELLADIPAVSADGALSKVVGLVDAPGGKFVFSLYDAGEIWIADPSDPRNPRITKFTGVGDQPYDALLTPEGRYYVAGLFGEDGMALIDLWDGEPKVRRILQTQGRGGEKLPVYKMPHLEGWGYAGRYSVVPAVGKHEVILVDNESWEEVARIAVLGQPVFAMARPDGRHVWINFAFPHYGKVQVLDVQSREIIRTLEPGKAVLHMEFAPRGEEVWVSARDDDRVIVYDTRSFEKIAELEARHPSGIFLSARANRLGL